MHATRASQPRRRIVPGGGTALLRVIPAVQKLHDSLHGDEKLGAAIVLRSLEEPVRHIASNGGHDGGVVADEVKTRGGSFGFNANTGEYVDMFASGIVDPTKVTRSALQNAASIAGLMLTTEAMITNIKEDEEKGAARVEGQSDNPHSPRGRPIRSAPAGRVRFGRQS